MEKRKLYHHVSASLGSKNMDTNVGDRKGFCGDPLPVHTLQQLSPNLSVNTHIVVRIYTQTHIHVEILHV